MFNTPYHLSLSRFNEGKEIRIICSKMTLKYNAKCCGDVAATLWQRLDNVGERRCHNVVNRRRHNSNFRPCHNVVTTSTTTLSQRCHNVAVPAWIEHWNWNWIINFCYHLQLFKTIDLVFCRFDSLLVENMVSINNVKTPPKSTLFSTLLKYYLGFWVIFLNRW